MAHLVPQFVKNALLLLLTILVYWLQVTALETVQLKYTISTVKRDSMPDELHVTLTGETGTSSEVQLRLLQHSVPDVPVYTLGVDESGQHVKHLEELEVNPNVAYYHDLNNNAVMQVTKTAGHDDKEAHYELQGDLAIEGQKYSLNPNKRFQREPSSPSEAESYTLIPQEPPRFASRDHASVRGKVRGRKARRVKPIFIDVAAVIDYVAYSRFRASSRSQKEALQKVKLYYAFIFSAVDMMYKSINDSRYPITVSLIKIIILKTAATSQVTLRFKLANSNQADVHKALEAFKVFSQISKNGITRSDHAMLFSGYDLAKISTRGIASNQNAGSAYLSKLCKKDGTSTSIIEDFGVVQTTVYNAAHELGHSLGASHDQDGNTCQSADSFIMAPDIKAETSTNKYNPWLFSSCSIASFMSYINQTLRTKSGEKCLLYQLTARQIPDVSRRLPGQVYSVDQQCRMIYGERSSMCRRYHSSDVCTRLLCRKPSNNVCIVYKTATGITCGNKKWCISGKCVYDPRAPAVDDNCVFGDTPGVAIENLSCSQYVNSFNGSCYQSWVQKKCCQSCKDVFRNVTGCEYGDKSTFCDFKSCSVYSDGERSDCCRTCSLVPDQNPQDLTIFNQRHL